MAHIKRYFPSILQNYLTDKRQTSLDLNKNKPNSFNRVDAVHSYLILSENPGMKSSRIMQTVNKYISQKEKELLAEKQIEPSNAQSFGVMISKLIMLMKYNSHNTQSLHSLLQYVLFADRLHHSEITALLRLLNENVDPSGQMSKKLLGHVRDGIQQYLQRNEIIKYPYRYISILSKITLLPRPLLFNRLGYNLLYNLDKIIQRGDSYFLHQTLSLQSRKSTKQLMRFGLKENSLAKKRLIYEIIAKRMNIDSAKYVLPGKICKNQQQVINKSKFLSLLTHNEQFLDYSIQREQQGQNQQRLLEFKLFIDNLFSFIQSANANLQSTQLVQITSRINYLWQNHINQASALVSKNISYILKYIIIACYLRTHHRDYQTKTTFNKYFTQWLCSEKISLNHFSKEIRQSQTFIPFLLLQCLTHIKAQKYEYSISQSLISLQLISELLKELNKGEDKKRYTLLKEVYDYTQLWLKIKQTPQSKKLTQVLSSQLCDKLLTNLIEFNQHKNEQTNLKIIKLMSKVNEKWDFMKNVYLQPNVHLNYCIVDKRSKLPLACFESAQSSQKYLVRNRSIYEKQINQICDLNLYGLWKRQFLKQVYECEFYCCNDESQLSQKICSFILKKTEQLTRL